jgi:hypothetical protein
VLLHVANLVACASNIGVRPNIIRRLQQLLDEVADEYNAAVREEAELESKLDRFLTHAVTRADRCFSLGVGWSSW